MMGHVCLLHDHTDVWIQMLKTITQKQKQMMVRVLIFEQDVWIQMRIILTKRLIELVCVKHVQTVKKMEMRKRLIVEVKNVLDVDDVWIQVPSIMILKQK